MQRNTQATGRVDIYQEVTDYIISQLERGEVPWHKAWNNLHGMPRNYTGTKLYRGFNAFFLNIVTVLCGYHYPFFLTFHQVKEMGGTVRKGEKSVRILFYESRQNLKETITVFDTSTGITRKDHPYYRVLKYHNVFNIAQCDGLPTPAADPAPRAEHERIAACESIIAGMPDCPPIAFGQHDPCYLPEHDRVCMPKLGNFECAEEYYSTLFHELAHSTGHKGRLNREGIITPCVYGSQLYAKEELIAELTAAYLSGIAGTVVSIRDNSTAYIQGFLHDLRQDKKFFLQACTQAAAAADYILRATPVHAEQETADAEAA